ncbi:sigma-70 family RNA polymerase sigma factor [Sorangium sp. So ce295]|uniref:sigma-70 family RNA polymerase sigma factor n=1 Tax=Sorangium sp. So ce295 TaxID=3133295 RepID=UPI003F5D5ED5
MTAQDEDDHLLLSAARAGDKEALTRLIERHQAQVYRFGMKMCRDPEDAKDVLQETLLAMARGIRDFRGASSISTWLYTIARGFCLKKRRRSKFAPVEERSLDAEAAPEATQVADPAKGPHEELAGRQVERAIEQAIAALDPKLREALILRDVEGLTAPEVAEVLGVGVQAVKSRLHRARLAVRAHVAPLLGIPAAATAPGRCPDVLTLYSQHIEDEISPDVCASVERHLEACPRCRGACDSLKRTLALCKAAPASQVPANIQDSIRKKLQDLLADFS